MKKHITITVRTRISSRCRHKNEIKDFRTTHTLTIMPLFRLDVKLFTFKEEKMHKKSSFLTEAFGECVALLWLCSVHLSYHCVNEITWCLLQTIAADEPNANERTNGKIWIIEMTHIKLCVSCHRRRLPLFVSCSSHKSTSHPTNHI